MSPHRSPAAFGTGVTGPPGAAAVRRRTAGYLKGPVAIAFALLLAIAYGAPAAAGAPRDARDVPLVDQNGVSFTLRDLHRPTAVIFVATRCGDACPIAEGLFSRLSDRLARAHVDARLLTVTRLLDAFNVARLDGKFHGTFAYVLDAQARPMRLVMLSTNTDRELLDLLRTVPRG